MSSVSKDSEHSFDIVGHRRRSVVAECPCCRRNALLTYHHLIPRKLHRRNRFKKNYTREQLNQGIEVCRQCHSGIHARYDEMTLCQNFSEPAAILSDPELSKFFEWVSRQRVNF